jgi:hypothetical protein
MTQTSTGRNPLLGTIDMHIHGAPDVVARCMNDIELCQKAKEMGMTGMVIKNHEFITNDRAYLVRQVVPGLELFGGITLNRSVGGINPVAVETMIRFTGNCGKVVWLPTHDAAHDIAFFEKSGIAGIRIIDASGRVLPELRKVLERIAKADVLFATGHVSPVESLAAVEAAREEGVRRVLVTHAMQSPVEMSIDDMKRCVEMGAFIEHTYLPFLAGPNAPLEWMRVRRRHISMETYAQAIRALGAEHCIISTDLGQHKNTTPTDGMKAFILGLNQYGITDEEIHWMAVRNPSRLLGLDAL